MALTARLTPTPPPVPKERFNMTASRTRLLSVGASALFLLGAVLAGSGIGIAAGSWLVGLLVFLGTGLLGGGFLLAGGAVLVSLRGVQRASASASREITAIRKDASRILWRTEPVRATAGSVSRVREQLDLLLQPTMENQRRFASVSRGEVRKIPQRDAVDSSVSCARSEGAPTAADLPEGKIGLVLGSTDVLSAETERPFTILAPERDTLPSGATAMVVDEAALYTGPWADSPDGPKRIVELALAARIAEVPVLLLAVHGGEHPARSPLREQVDGIIDGKKWLLEPDATVSERIQHVFAALTPLGL